MPEPDRDPILLHLRRIRLVGDIPACVYVLGHIIAPEDLRVCLETSPINIGPYIHPRTFRFPLPDASIESWPLRNDTGPFASCMLACGGDSRAAGVFTLRSGETKCSSPTSPTATSESRISSSDFRCGRLCHRGSPAVHRCGGGDLGNKSISSQWIRTRAKCGRL